MRKLLAAACAAIALAGCSESSSDPDACRVFSEVEEQIVAYEPGSASDEEVERNRQWEFRLAQASVMATDHDLSDDLRSIAYLASAVPNGTDEDKQAFLDAAASVRDRCE